MTPRFGIVVSAAGGAFAAMLPAFKAGLGARLGDGDQYWAWVALDDLLAAFEWALHDEELEGVVNVTAPEPLDEPRGHEDAGHGAAPPGRAGGARPSSCVTARAAWASEMLLASQRAMPARLKERGFRFAFPALEGALRYELGRS